MTWLSYSASSYRLLQEGLPVRKGDCGGERTVTLALAPGEYTLLLTNEFGFTSPRPLSVGQTPLHLELP